MQRLKVTLRPEAIADLKAIYRSIAQASQSHGVASGFVDRIVARCRRIGDVPYGGRPRDDLQSGLRVVPFERSAVVAYRVGKVIEIVNVFYGGRDYEAVYRSGEDAEE